MVSLFLSPPTVTVVQEYCVENRLINACLRPLQAGAETIPKIVLVETTLEHVEIHGYTKRWEGWFYDLSKKYPHVL